MPRFSPSASQIATAGSGNGTAVAGHNYSTTPAATPAETKCCFHNDLAEQGHEPLTMDSQFASLEVAQHLLLIRPDVRP